MICYRGTWGGGGGYLPGVKKLRFLAEGGGGGGGGGGGKYGSLIGCCSLKKNSVF